MRYFLTLSYLGTRYSGWQIQPNAPSVQETLEQALSTLLRRNTEITGCGRTDAGVHARYYVAHFDADGALPKTFLNGVNSILPPDIAIHEARPVHAEAHARFDAFERSYAYHISLRKDPFSTDMAWFYPNYRALDLQKLKETAELLLHYQAFFPFCKTHSGVDNYGCDLKRASWEIPEGAHEMIFHITANRFLRGMVRLIVGACIQVATGKLDLNDVKRALDEQKTLKKSLSVPPHGLFLTAVHYPY
jgi:tRNA pseudouridine38-40 synthase